MTAESGDVLPDLYSGTFSYQGNDFSTARPPRRSPAQALIDLTATLDYSYGGALDLSRPDVQLQDARDQYAPCAVRPSPPNSAETCPRPKRIWSRHTAIRLDQAYSVDLFNTSPGQADPYLNLFIRQPIPSSLAAGHMELLVDFRNLLAEGYVPVMGTDGRTVYLVQSARSVRGGLAFNF